jgi:hypothetical protein
MNTNEERQLCSVNGMLAPGVMCGRVVVGLQYCSLPAGRCEHQQAPIKETPDTKDPTT